MMVSPVPPSHAVGLSSPRLHRWLAQVRAAGLSVSTHEVLACHLLWWRWAVQGRLPVADLDRLRLLGPLLCHTPEQQRVYHGLLEAQGRAEVQADMAAPTSDEPNEGPAGGDITTGWRAAWGRWAWWAGVAVVMGMLLALAWWGNHEPEHHKPPETQPPPAASVPAAAAEPVPVPPVASAPTAVSAASPPASRPDALPALEVPRPAYVPPQPLMAPSAVPPAEPASWEWLRWAAVALGGLCAWLSAWRLWRWWRRGRLFAQAAALPEERVIQRVLYDPHAPPVRPRAVVLRPVATALRQPVQGTRMRLDVRASIHATVRRGGQWTPRLVVNKVTPEYLALIERAGPRDQQARFHEAMVTALEAQGVAVQVFYYRGTPQQGCWRLAPADATGYRAALDAMSFSALVSRYSHHRLLVFGPTRASHDPDSGAFLPWLKEVQAFAHRAWFTPLPLPSWGALEHWLSSAEGPDFLLLPMEEAALPALAGWLASGRAVLTPDPQGPLRYPAMLSGLGAEQRWAFQAREPSAHELRLLMVQLRAYMGESRMAWLAACAIFPALSWPLTLGLGRQVLAYQAAQPQAQGRDVEAELALGVSILAALPWFRHGKLPDWLRAHLLADPALAPGLQQALRDWLERYLGEHGQPQADGEEMGRLARPRLAAWLRRVRGRLNDVLLLRFMEPALAHPLLARLPESWRHLLFNRGLALLGLRPAVSWLLSGPAVLVVLAWPGVWQVFSGWMPQLERMQVTESPAVASAPRPQQQQLPPPAPASAQAAPTPGQTVRECVNNVCFDMVAIPTGSFQMGSPDTEPGRYSDEGPVHTVNVKGFWLGKTEVTQGLWKAVMGSNPSYFKDCGDKCPVEMVSWNDAQEFIKKLNGLTGKKYRLPSESEWEYGARAGTKTRWSFGDDESQLGGYAWYTSNSGGKTHEVGQKKPNQWGLYDIHGNVREWVQDAWVDNYNGAPTDGSAREENSVVARVLRGGSWNNYPLFLRSAYRVRNSPDDRGGNLGLRLARTN